MTEFATLIQAVHASAAERADAEAVMIKEISGLAGMANAETLARVKEARRREQFCLKALLYESETLDAEARRARQSVPYGEWLLGA
nr:hypothetical protein [Variovorax boronicumulans]